MSMPQHEWTAVATAVLAAEAQALTRVAAQLDDSITRAVEMIVETPGKVIISGMGKSGHIGHKIAATMCSTGTPAVFLHPAEAFHGDLGLYTPGDPTILLSKSGTTAELLKLIPVLREFRSPLIAIVGNRNSPLAEQVDVCIDASVQHEADPDNLVPTSSTTVTMALGDALAITLMRARQFTPEDFARYHPGGQLGRNLRLRVEEVMHVNGSVAWLTLDMPLKQIVIQMTRYPLGAACIVDEHDGLVGIITDGDLRRALMKHDNIELLTANDIMTRNPVTVQHRATLQEALHLMEDRPSQISELPVVDSMTGKCLGLIRLHDVYQLDGTRRK